MKYNIIGPI